MSKLAHFGRKPFPYAALTLLSSNRLLYAHKIPGPNDSSIIAIPDAIPKPDTIGAQQSFRLLTITWLGIAINNSSTLPRSSHRVTRSITSDAPRLYK